MTAMPTVAEALQLAVRALSGHSESPRLDAELLLCKVLGLSRSGLIVHDTAPVALASGQAYGKLLEQRVSGAPIAYLTGTREFWSLPLTVTPDVLVPRPETELLVAQALELLPADAAPGDPAPAPSVLDLGTGSGAIALAIALERPRAQVTAVDVSDKALAVAAANAARLGAQVDWRLGSWFDAVPGRRFDLIVANPPYVASGDPALAALAVEPALALTPGPTGLEALAAIAESAARHLHPRGWLLLEHGPTQAAAVAAMLERRGFTHIRSRVDFSGNPRITLGTIHQPQQERT